MRSLSNHKVIDFIKFLISVRSSKEVSFLVTDYKILLSGFSVEDF